MHTNKLIAALFLVSCAQTQNQVETAVKAVKDCSYLEEYAVDISDALNNKDYNLAMNVAGNAYMRALEDVNTPCLKDAKALTSHVTQFIVDSSK